MDNKEELDYNEIGKITSDFIKVSDQLKTTCEKNKARTNLLIWFFNI